MLARKWRAKARSGEDEPGIDGIAGGYLPPAYRGNPRIGGTNVLTTGRPGGQSGAPVMVSARQHDEATVRGHWPLCSHIALGALSGAVPSARLHARHVLLEWGQKSLAEDAELIVSELTTNAVTASQAIDSLHPVRLWLLSDGSRTLILLGDASSHPPRRSIWIRVRSMAAAGYFSSKPLAAIGAGTSFTESMSRRSSGPSFAFYLELARPRMFTTLTGEPTPCQARGLVAIARRELCQQMATDSLRRPGTARPRP